MTVKNAVNISLKWMLKVVKVFFWLVLILLIAFTLLWVGTNHYYLYKIKNFRLRNGETVISTVNQKYGSKAKGLKFEWDARHDMWFFNSIVSCSVINSNDEILATLLWETEGDEILAATNRTREITPELGPPCDTSDLAFDQRFGPFSICFK